MRTKLEPKTALDSTGSPPSEPRLRPKVADRGGKGDEFRRIAGQKKAQKANPAPPTLENRVVELPKATPSRSISRRVGPRGQGDFERAGHA